MQSDTEVQPNSHLLQSQEHNVQIKKVENSLAFISMQRPAVHLLAANESSDTQRLSPQYKNSPLQTIRCPYCLAKVTEKARRPPCYLLLRGRGKGEGGDVDSRNTSLPLLNQHIIAMFAPGTELFTSVFTGRAKASAGRARPQSLVADLAIMCYLICGDSAGGVTRSAGLHGPGCITSSLSL